jgi:hypothetical protein
MGNCTQSIKQCLRVVTGSMRRRGQLQQRQRFHRDLPRNFEYPAELPWGAQWVGEIQ